MGYRYPACAWQTLNRLGVSFRQMAGMKIFFTPASFALWMTSSKSSANSFPSRCEWVSIIRLNLLISPAEKGVGEEAQLGFLLVCNLYFVEALQRDGEELLYFLLSQFVDA